VSKAEIEEDIDYEDVVTPYAIRNVTNMPIYVFTLIDGKYAKERQVQIKPGRIKDIAVSVDMKNAIKH